MHDLAPESIVGDRFRLRLALPGDGWIDRFAATDLRTGEAIELRVWRWPLDPGEPERVVRGARGLATLTGEHLVRIRDAGVLATEQTWIAAELVTGDDLAAWLAARGVVGPAGAVDLALEVCDALAEAHAAGFLHLHLRPEHLVVTGTRHGAPSIKLRGFDAIEPRHEPSDSAADPMPGLLEAAPYLAPEQLHGEARPGPAADQWALGTVLYECVTGRRAFDGDGVMAIVERILRGSRPLLDVTLPLGLADVIDRCLDQDPGARFAGIAALAAALAPFAGDDARAAAVVTRTAARAG